MFDLLIILVMIGIVISLAFGLYFLINDSGKTDRTAWSLTIRVSLAALLLILLAFGFMQRVPG